MIRIMVILVLAGLSFLQGLSPPVAAFIEANIEAVEYAKAQGSFEDGPYPFGGMAPNLTTLGSHYEFSGIARNPFAYEFCPEQYCPMPMPTPGLQQIRAEATPVPTLNLTPEPTDEPTPEPTPKPTPEPTEEPWACPAVGDCTKKEYKDLCVLVCEATGQHGCAGICNQCWKESGK